jgi:hypothetical protein
MPSPRPRALFVVLLALTAACGEPRSRSLDPVSVDSGGPVDARRAEAGGTGMGGEAGGGGSGGSGYEPDSSAPGTGGIAGTADAAPQPQPDGPPPVAADSGAIASPDAPPAPPDAAPPPTCMNACQLTETRCQDGRQQACEATPSGCTRWAASQSCPPPQSCPTNARQCACPTQDACPIEGTRRCAQNGLQTCSRDGACLRWGSPAPCEFGCDPATNSCRPCRNGCPDVGRTSCGTRGVRECVLQSNGCTDWGPERACPSTCREGGSGASCCGDGMVGGDERCDPGSSASTDLGACTPECSGFYEKKFIRHTGTDFYPGNLGGPAGADQICRSKFGAGYKALLVGGARRATVSPNRGDGQMDWVIRKYTHYFNEGNVLVWRTDSTALLGVRDGQRVNLFADVFGNDRTYPWGAYESDWTTIQDSPATFRGNCQGWTTSSQDAWGNFPIRDLQVGASEPCSSAMPLLCVEQ